MASRKDRLDIVYSERAVKTFADILEWSTERFGDSVAARYVQGLRQAVRRLGKYPLSGHPLTPDRPYRYLVFRARGGAKGHIVVYVVALERIEVVALFHTSQDWRGRIERGELD
jgi:plasmid stabilization system protein ParE